MAAPRLLVLMVVVLMAGCSAAAPPVPAADAAVVPWADLPYVDPPEPSVSPRPPATACVPSAIQMIEVNRDGAGGTSIHTLAVRNAGATACTLAGHPALTGRRKGKTGPIAAGTDTMMPPPIAGSTPATIEPGEEADVHIETYGGCLDGRPEIIYTDVRVASLVLGEELNATCGVNVGPWWRVTPPPAPLGLTAQIAAPASVQRGAELAFTVTLVNNQDHPVRLEPCPNFVMGITAAKVGGAHQLNCQGRSIPAGGRLAFAMVMLMPASASTGPATITWMLDEAQADPAPITVT